MAALRLDSSVMKRCGGVISVGMVFLLLLVSPAVQAQSALWLPPGSATSAETPIPELISSEAKIEGEILLGKLLFNSPSILGEKAVRIGLSCNSCHPSGHVNTSFYINGLSNEPGQVDLTNRFWREEREDNLFNPLPIPSLRNVRNTAPYGSTISLPTLAAFTRHVMYEEFGGPEPSKEVLDALVAYMSILEKSPAPDTPAHVEAIPMSPLLKLLQNSVQKQDVENYTTVSGLVREEIGRQITKQNEAFLISIARDLKEIAALFSKAPDQIEGAYQKLLTRASHLNSAHQ